MQALVFQGVGEPQVLEERPPLEATPGEAVVTLRAAALNRRDYFVTQGLYPGIDPPHVLGSDGAGVVARVGDGVDAAWIGREVILNPGLGWGDDGAAQDKAFHILGLPRDGTFAAEVGVPVEQLHSKPEPLSWPEAAALPLAGVTAFRALFTQGGLQPGETVLVTGAGGGVATMALQFAVAAGAVVWVTSSSQEKIARAVQLGARGGENYRQEDWGQRLVQAAGAPALIVDGAGGPGYAVLVQIAAPGGRIVNYGATAGAADRLDLFKVFWKQLRLQGSTMGSPSDFAAMLDFVQRHALRPAIDAVIPLAEGAAAIERMAAAPQFGKVVLEISTP